MSSNKSASRLQQLLPQLFEPNIAAGEPYLRFQLTATMTALMSMAQVQESLVVDAEQITSLPNLPQFVVGMMSSRNRVFSVVDLESLLMLPSASNTSRQFHVVVLQTSGAEAETNVLVGIAVKRILGITRLIDRQIQSTTEAFSSNLSEYLCGSVVEAETIPVFDSKKITEAISS